MGCYTIWLKNPNFLSGWNKILKHAKRGLIKLLSEELKNAVHLPQKKSRVFYILILLQIQRLKKSNYLSIYLSTYLYIYVHIYKYRWNIKNQINISESKLLKWIKSTMGLRFSDLLVFFSTFGSLYYLFIC